MNNIEREKQIQQVQRQIRFVKKVFSSGNLYYIWDALGVDVPKIQSRPILRNYGITQTDVDRIPYEQKANKEKLEKRKRIITLICITIGILIGLVSAYLYAIESAISSSGIGVGEVIGLCLIHGVIGAAGGGFLLAIVTTTHLWKKNPEKSENEKKYDQYRMDLNHYEYWQWKKQKVYWLSLNGEEFEHALAALYRNLGYQAEVTKSGGDKGIDIIVRGAGKPDFIVQCKAHKNKISPSPIRDFYGTMVHGNYSKGVFASLSGFTSGAKEFAVDKNIILIDVNNIIDGEIL
ncbi:MAG: hypothetical protein GX222_04745 [Ruminococcaceae bacterium]|nr:hypothetical protein [Oscillospiraceae bacterium]